MRKLLLKILKLPPDPEPPAGSHDSVKIFRASKNFFYVLLVKWVFTQIGVLFGVAFALFYILPWTQELPGYLPEIIGVLEAIGIMFVVFQAAFTFVMVHMDYELRWYIVTDRSIRIRAGVREVREMTMTIANIQHASVSQGPIQRMLGISDLLVRTAGGGAGIEQASQHQKGAGEMMHIGYFHGVDNAEEIKELIQERMRKYNDTGLGDPDEPVVVQNEHEETVESELLLAARAFAAEAKALRSAVIRADN